MTSVLLIEDNPGDARLVREAFIEAGKGDFEVIHASDLMSGLLRLDEGGIDVVVSDLDLPDAEDLGAVSRLRAHARGIPILVLTGTHDEARGIDAVRFGIQDYLLKDELEAQNLVRAVRYAIERKRAEETVADAGRKLGRANRELEEARADLERRVEERTAELARANRDLENLLYVATHDLKEPLNAIAAISEMLTTRHAEHLDEKGKDLVVRMARGASRMRRLLEDLLVLTRTQRIEVPPESCAAEEIVAEAMARLGDKVRASGADVHVETPLPRLRVHRTWAIEAIANLISNALKFTSPGAAPEIRIAPYSGEEGAGILVGDRGPGVSPELAERIFKLFQRGVSREVEGTGAGLAIVRQIAERHCGRAWVRARDGGGSEFIVTFGPPEPAVSGLELLLVDDDEDFLFIMKESLTENDLVRKVIVARDGVEALDILRKVGGFRSASTPDVVLLDINMPRKNGFEVLEEIHRDPNLRGIPVAIVTSSVRKEDETRSMASGASAYLTKPFQIEDLLATVRRLSSNSEKPGHKPGT
jgi:signal transduction histidine kinase